MFVSLSFTKELLSWGGGGGGYIVNLVPRSLVDEAEGEIWHSKKICFFLIACSVCLLPNPLFENWRGFPRLTFFKLKF